MNFIVYLISINIISFISFGIDKRKAIKGHWRISEEFLIIISLIGGCFGGYLGMKFFRHKTKKIKFKLVGFFCLIWIYLLVHLFT